MRARPAFAIIAILLVAACGDGKKIDARPGVPATIAAGAFHARGYEVRTPRGQDPYPAPVRMPDDVMLPDDPFGMPEYAPPSSSKPSPGTHL